MKILLIHPHDIFSFEEPWCVRIRSIANKMHALGHDVAIAHFPLLNKKDKRIANDLVAGVDVIEFTRKCGPHHLLKNTLRMVKLARRFDVVHFQKCFYHAAVPAVVAAWALGKPLHYDWDDWETQLYFDGGKPPSVLIGYFMMFAEWALPHICDTVSAASNQIREHLDRMRVRAPVWPAPIGVDLEQFEPRPEAGARKRQQLGITGPCVVYCGQLHGGQYAELLVRAVPALLKDIPDIQVVFVGDGHRRCELERKVEQLDLAGHIRFTGFLDHAVVPEYIAMADVCVACFEDNAITRCKSPLKLAEYMASAKAIVCSRVGEAGKMLGKAAVLVEPGCEKALADGIKDVLCNPGLRSELERKAYARAHEHFSWVNTATNMLDAYRVGLAKKGSPLCFTHITVPEADTGFGRVHRFSCCVFEKGCFKVFARVYADVALNLELIHDYVLLGDAKKVIITGNYVWVELGTAQLSSGVHDFQLHADSKVRADALKLVRS